MDDYFGRCKKCNKKAVTAINAGDTPLCAYHFIKQEDDECLVSRLKEQIDEMGKIMEEKEIQLEIKKQKPKVYEYLKEYFSI